MSDFMIIFNWINLFATSALRIHVIINAYFFFSLFLANHFTLFIYNLECMISWIFFIIFASSFLMSWNMLLTFISCIIILNLSRRKTAVEATFLIQKLLNFNIFLLFSKTTLKIISSLNFLIFTIFLRAVSVSSMFDLCVKTIIFAALIFCIRFIFYFSLIHVINFISLFDLRFEKALISRKKSVEIAIVDCLIVIFIQIFSLIVSFIFSIIFFSFLITFFSFVIWLSKHLFAVFVTLAQSWRVACLIILKNFVIIVHDIIFDRFFSFNS